MVRGCVQGGIVGDQHGAVMLEKKLNAGSSEPLRVLTIDLDRFKSFNDTLGYAAGDAVLRTIASRLAQCVGAHGTLGHLAKDEFVILLENQDLKSPGMMINGAAESGLSIPA